MTEIESDIRKLKARMDVIEDRHVDIVVMLQDMMDAESEPEKPAPDWRGMVEDVVKEFDLASPGTLFEVLGRFIANARDMLAKYPKGKE